MFVEEAGAGDESEKEPEPRASAVQNTEDDGGAKHPEDRFESIHGEKIVEGQIDGRQKHEERSKELGEFAAADFAGHPAGEQNFGRGRKGRQKAERKERIAEERACQRRCKGYERGMVNVARG